MRLKNYLTNSVNAFILAGGKGTRLTPKKSLIKINNKSIIETTTDLLSSLFRQVSIISNNKDLHSSLNLPIYTDIFPNAGPKGGIYSGLYNSQTEWNFFIACDMPFISETVIIKLAEFLSYKYECIIPFVNNYYEPLFAFYKKSYLQ
ncbi:MAG: NTP transferase domain-containing protein [Proteobacteria bacterium]|nr:NTP transferase domain-containing protein [Pseudomonadota bacterium]